MINKNRIKHPDLAKVLAAAIATSACGTEINNHFYGPNGEEITSSGEGNCDGFKGKHLSGAWKCRAGTVETYWK